MKKIVILMIVFLLCVCDICPVKATEAEGYVVIVLDPGHDSTHGGAADNGVREEKLNIKIAQYCYEELSTYQNVKVYMTRDSEKCPYPGTSVKDDNEKRVEFAKSVGADAYVSLHLNAAAAAAKGVEIFYPNTSYRPGLSTIGKNLAESVMDELVGLGLHERGIFIRNGETSRYEDGSVGDYYQVIREAKKKNMPAIIVEHAFVSNESDVENFLSTETQLKALGVADATGIAQYFNLKKTMSDQETKPDIDINTSTEIKPSTENQLNTETKPDTDSNSDWENEPGTEGKPATETESVTESESDTDTEIAEEPKNPNSSGMNSQDAHMQVGAGTQRDHWIGWLILLIIIVLAGIGFKIYLNKKQKNKSE